MKTIFTEIEIVSHLIKSGAVILRKALILTTAILCFTTTPANCASSASDNAGIDQAWYNGGNGGYGFAPWTIYSSTNISWQSGFFTSQSLIDDGGWSWGLYANSAQTANAFRPFTGGPLLPGQQFSIVMLKNAVQSGGAVGFSLQDSAQNNRFEFYYSGGNANYTINLWDIAHNPHEYDTGVPSTAAGLKIIFTQFGNNQFLLDITPLGGTTTSLSGLIANSDITKVRLFNYNSGFDSPHNCFFNDISVSTSPPTPQSPGTSSDTSYMVGNLTPTFSWTGVSVASRYGFYISHYPYGAANIIYSNITLTGTAFQIPSGYLQPNTKYRWNMTSFDGSGIEGNVSGRLYFQTAAATQFAPSITTQPQSQTLAVGASATFSVTASGTGQLSYQWYFNNTPISGATSASLTIPNAQLANVGSYSVIVSNPYGAVTSATAALKLLGVDLSQPCYLMTATPLPARQSGKNNLILVTHGWQPGLTEPAPPQWVSDLCGNLQTRVPSNWQVIPYFWVDQAWTYPGNVISLENSVLGNAQNIGTQIGRQIVEQGWQHIHLIGHSAGSALIQAATDAVRSGAPNTIVHTTFLDPFLGLDGRGISWYGANANWSDNYYAHDSTGVFTQGQLPNAYNVDVSWLFTTPLIFPSGNNGQVAYATHDWPHDFFNETVTNILPTWCGANYGFALSEEGSQWADTAGDIKGNVPLVLCGSASAVQNPYPLQTSPMILISILEKAWSLGVSFVGDAGFILNSAVSLIPPKGQIKFNGQPQKNSVTNSTGMTAWLAVGLTITNIVNFIQFDAAFTDTNNAEGLLTVYWDTNQIGTVDERVVSSSLQPYRFFLPNTVTNNIYVLGFRLDSFDGTSSSIMITNVATGFAGINTPITLGISLTNATPLLQLTGASNYSYLVETSTNLVNWTPTALLVNSNGTVVFPDPSATNSGSRFYRATMP